MLFTSNNISWYKHIYGCSHVWYYILSHWKVKNILSDCDDNCDHNNKYVQLYWQKHKYEFNLRVSINVWKFLPLWHVIYLLVQVLITTPYNLSTFGYGKIIFTATLYCWSQGLMLCLMERWRDSKVDISSFHKTWRGFITQVL